jgi:pre-mRNA-splicing factor 38A
MYVRMTFRAVEVYELLEPLLNDYRKLRQLSMCTFYISALP